MRTRKRRKPIPTVDRGYCVKVAYKTRRVAERGLSRHDHHHDLQDAPSNVYRCPEGDHWHLTSRGQR